MQVVVRGKPPSDPPRRASEPRDRPRMPLGKVGVWGGGVRGVSKGSKQREQEGVNREGCGVRGKGAKGGKVGRVRWGGVGGDLREEATTSWKALAGTPLAT